ncbi:hypothetical protein L2E82_34066 [Cichorium intybus]|uniref:Uncharacterized protein n=1 Tax=Cichorium intybus TaxID=13427 RepID=A0ACB9BLN4_CICIN|nr:hypothetical protein L2E82_34066 [Cichorium intybus]
MVTDDNRSTVTAIAKEIGIENVFTESDKSSCFIMDYCQWVTPRCDMNTNGGILKRGSAQEKFFRFFFLFTSSSPSAPSSSSLQKFRVLIEPNRNRIPLHPAKSRTAEHSNHHLVLAAIKRP